MKALQLVATGRLLEAAEIPAPEPGPGELRVRVHAAGICHSDAHYRAGEAPAGPLPLTPGHEVAGVVELVGAEVEPARLGERVALHYLVSCGACGFCARGEEAFCAQARMLGKDRDGGYAEAVCVPARNAFPLPDKVSFAQGAVAMCSAATAYHACRKARVGAGDTVAVFGAGGLGVAAVQIARLLGAARVFAVDPQPAKRELAAALGAEPLDPADGDPADRIRGLAGGADAALELVGLAVTMEQAVRCLGVQGRAAIAGLHAGRFSIAPYRDLLAKEAEVVGVSDHRAAELPQLLAWVAEGRLDLARGITATVPLEAAEVNAVLDGLDRFGPQVRVVIEPAP